VEHGTAGARYAALLKAYAMQQCVLAPLALRYQRIATEELMLPVNDPFATRLEWRLTPIKVATGEQHAALEA
jgi:hypothetical protein